MSEESETPNERGVNPELLPWEVVSITGDSVSVNGALLPAPERTFEATACNVRREHEEVVFSFVAEVGARTLGICVVAVPLASVQQSVVNDAVNKMVAYGATFGLQVASDRRVEMGVVDADSVSFQRASLLVPFTASTLASLSFYRAVPSGALRTRVLNAHDQPVVLDELIEPIVRVTMHVGLVAAVIERVRGL